MGISNLSFSATNVLTGLYADIPATPCEGDEYNATDTANKYVCFSDETWTKLDVGESVRSNIAVNAFRIAINGSLTRFNLQDGVIDDFQDDSGVLSGGDVAAGVLTHNLSGLSSNVFSTLEASEQITPTAYTLAVTYADIPKGIIKCNWTSARSGSGTVLTQIKINGVFTGNEQALGVTEEFIKTEAGDTVEIWGKISAATYMLISAGATAALVETPTIISQSVTAEAQPTNIHAVILADDATITLNTDLKLYASVDDGATWKQITLEDSGDYSATAKILTGSIVITGTGTDVKYKTECEQMDYEIYAVGLLWD